MTFHAVVVATAVLLVSGHQARNITIEAPPALAGVASRIEAMDVTRITRALAQAGLTLPPTIHIALVESDAPAARQLPSWIVGQAFGTEAIIIFPDRIGSYPYDSLESVVLHEIAHLALSARAGEQPLPRWFHEGVAVSVESGWGLQGQVRLLATAARDPALDDVSALFASDALPSTTTAYLLSAALVDDLRRNHGAAAPGLIAGRVADGEPFEQAFLHVTGQTPDVAAANAWRLYRGLRWLPVLTSASSVWGGILVLAGVAFLVRLRRRQLQRQRWQAEEVTADDRTEVESEPESTSSSIH